MPAEIYTYEDTSESDITANERVADETQSGSSNSSNSAESVNYSPEIVSYAEQYFSSERYPELPRERIHKAVQEYVDKGIVYDELPGYTEYINTDLQMEQVENFCNILHSAKDALGEKKYADFERAFLANDNTTIVKAMYGDEKSANTLKNVIRENIELDENESALVYNHIIPDFCTYTTTYHDYITYTERVKNLSVDQIKDLLKIFLKEFGQIINRFGLRNIMDLLEQYLEGKITNLKAYEEEIIKTLALIIWKRPDVNELYLMGF